MVSLGLCCNRFAALSRAAARAGMARLQRLGLARVHPEWARRASICETCPLRVIHRGASYCGTPFLSRIDRDAADGCGCPCIPKAKAREEHCPLDRELHPARQSGGRCSCRWCSA